MKTATKRHKSPREHAYSLIILHLNLNDDVGNDLCDDFLKAVRHSIVSFETANYFCDEFSDRDLEELGMVLRGQLKIDLMVIKNWFWENRKQLPKYFKKK